MNKYIATIQIKIEDKKPENFEVVALSAINSMVGHALVQAYIDSLNTNECIGKHNTRLSYTISSFCRYNILTPLS